jgi:hypothetical protein
VITCKSCGGLVQAHLANCQYCGMPLSNANQGDLGSSKGVHEQSELPSWLESLRVNERPNSPASGQPFFSTADLIDEGALPSWMRPENAEMMEKGNSGKYPAWRSASLPASNTDNTIIPPKGFPASSLIDEQSLPSWVQGGDRQNVQPATGATFAAHGSQEKFSAANLIQPDDMPSWMKSPPQPPQSAVSQNSVWEGERPSDSQVRVNSFTQDPSSFGSITPPQRLSAQDLVDPQAIPQWMSGQPDQPGRQAGRPPEAAPQSGPSRLSASSLLDVNSLPAWLHEEEQVQGQPGQVRVNTPGEPGPSESSRLSGASLIDVNALPHWLRSPGTQQQAGMPLPGNARPVAGGAPRIENVRVPGRPRSEMAPREESEAAANVFSSMLGVASSAPHFPPAGTQWNAPSQNAMAPSQGFQGGQPQAPAGTQWNGPSQPPGFGGAPAAQGYNPAGYPGGQQGAYLPGGPMGNARPGGVPMGGQPGMAQQPQRGVTGQQADSLGSKPAKRGFIETIRSWFS